MKKRKFLKIIIILLLLLAALTYDSNTRPALTEYSVSSHRLPESFDGFTVVQLSDFHGGLGKKANEKILEMTEGAKPDIIAITGDMVDSGTDMAVVDAFLGELTEIAPVYYVTGNHEWAAGKVDKLRNMINGDGDQGRRRMAELQELLHKWGVHYLSNSYELLDRGGEDIILAGVEDPNGYSDMLKPEEVVDIINEEREGGFTILLGHRNYWVENYPQLEVDIILSGHAHGGIVRLPFAGGVLGTGYELFPEHVEGVVESGRYSMVVSRGLGNSVPVPRFLNNPEIVVLRLESE